MKKYFITIALVIALTTGVASAATLTSAQINAIVSLLQSFGADQTAINKVQEVLSGSSFVAPECRIVLNKNLYFADETAGLKDEVTKLQKYLSEKGYFILPSNAQHGFFGRITLAALEAWQVANGISERDPKSGVAYVGEVSRRLINNCNFNPGNKPPVIMGLSAPSQLRVNEVGKWEVKAYDPEGGQLNYSIDWGEYLSSPAGTSAKVEALQTSTFTHGYSSAGTYKITFKVSDSNGKSAQTTTTVKVGDVSTNPISVVSPNGGEVWPLGSTQTIKWKHSISCSGLANSGACADPLIYIRVSKIYPSCLPTAGMGCPAIAYAPYNITKVSALLGSYSWTVGKNIEGWSMPAGDYRVQICLDNYGNSCDESDSYFTINEAQVRANLSTTVPRDEYLASEEVPIKVNLKNSSSENMVFNFTSTCQAFYTIQAVGGAVVFDSREGQACGAALTSFTLAPGESKSWDFTHKPGSLRLKPGSYYVSGQILGYRLDRADDKIQVFENITN